MNADDKKQAVIKKAVEQIRKAFSHDGVVDAHFITGAIADLLIDELPPEPLPTGQVRWDEKRKNAWQKTLSGIWLCGRMSHGCTDDDVRDLPVMQVIPEGHVAIDLSPLSEDALQSWAAVEDPHSRLEKALSPACRAYLALRGEQA